MSLYRISPALLWWLVGAQAIALLPHFGRIPIWVGMIFCLAAIWRLMVSYGYWPMPRKLTVYTLAIATTLSVYLSYGTLFAREPGIALLAVAFCLKLMELRFKRDSLLIIFLGYFLVAANFLYSQSLLMAAYMIVAFLLYTFVLLGLNRIGDVTPLRPVLNRTFAICLQAAPVAIAFYLFFPRADIQLLQMHTNEHKATSGLSDSLSFGKLSEVARSDEVVFRARFKGEHQPAKDELYWRGVTLPNFDGERWHIGPATPLQNLNQMRVDGSPLSYEITASLTPMPWIFALDYPLNIPSGIILQQDYHLAPISAKYQPRTYTVSSYPKAMIGLALEPWEKAIYTFLPKDSNVKSQALMQDFEQKASGDDELLTSLILHYFYTENFHYTLKPDTLNTPLFDDFLFNSRKGFCEHYASTMVYLLRLADVPARIVTGYLGGEFNPILKQWVVRQYHAHAWVEAWIDGKGWVRVDPVLAIAPERVEDPIPNVYQETAKDDFNLSLPTWLHLSIDAEWAKHLAWTWDALNGSWNAWVVDYSINTQSTFFEWLGIEEIKYSFFILSIFLALLCFTLPLYFMMSAFSHQSSISELVRAYQLLCKKLHQLGVQSSVYEGPMQLRERVVKHQSPNQTVLLALIDQYIVLQYQSASADKKNIKDFVSTVRKL